MNRISALCAAAACAAFLTGCAATSPRVVSISPPAAIDEENSYAGKTLYLSQFTVRNKSSKDSPRSEAALKAQFMDYLRDSAKFGQVIDATGGAKVPDDALKLNADFFLNEEGGKIGFYAAYLEMYLLWSISPRKGSAMVVGTSTLMRGRRTLSHKTWTSSQPFSFFFFGMFRTSPIQAAYKAAYEEVLGRIVVPVAGDSGPGVSRQELKSLVEEGIKEASKKAEPVYKSDVDQAAYKLPEDPDGFALVMGIEKYSTAPQADFGERDAQAVKDHLTALGYPLRNIVHLSGSMASRANIEKYVESWLPQKVTPRSKVFVFFSGHGAPALASGQAYLVPWDGDVQFLENTGYPLKRLYEKLNALKARRVIVALDSCFSGAGGRSLLPKGTRPLVTKVDAGSGDLGQVAALSASEADEITGSDDKQGHGLFTYYLLQGLNERKGEASLKELYDYLLPRVQDAARQQNRDQTPRLFSSGDEALSLRD